ncbi:MAG TPA: PilT/PilU family type 4a pilus ATPase [Candidatus Sumerlaeota bacterium]|nr:MAG: Twitching mobility protein [candidate division BRC1 bacterium ADurb.BinA292]HPK02041.1 PilT/PilU family type 4a pilus ATPase [Candidatus Sumerlaeota bacterium]
MAINMHKLLEGMVRVDASDLHLKVGGPPMIRMNGQLHPIDHPPLEAEDTEAANTLMMPPRCREQLERDGTVDYSYGLSPTQRFRINCFHQRGTKSLAIRKLVSKKVTLEDLNLPPQLTRLAKYHRGLVLVTGVTGSGKTSTLAAIINIINATRREHIITIEDPIEIVYTDEKCIIDQIEVNQDVVDFKCALRHALRQDPDIILLGELRDRETIETAMHCVDTGHLVFSTLHTPDARQTITRITHYFTLEEMPLILDQLSKNLQAVVCQRLVRTADGKGRVPCCEIMFNNPIIQKLIIEERIDDIQQVMRSGAEGMQTFDMHLVQLVKSERVTMEEANTVVEDEAAFRRLMKGISAGGDRGGLIG